MLLKEVCLILPEVTSSEEPGCSMLMQKVFDRVGPPRTYSPSRQEVEEEERSEAEDRMRTEARERVEEEKKEQEETRSRAERWEEWVGRGRTSCFLTGHIYLLRLTSCFLTGHIYLLRLTSCFLTGHIYLLRLTSCFLTGHINCSG